MNLPDFLTQDRYGEIFVKGHRVGLHHLLYFYNEGYSAEMLQAEYPRLPLDLVKRIISFYEANEKEVDAYLADSQAAMDLQRASARQSPDLKELRRRMEERRHAEGA